MIVVADTSPLNYLILLGHPDVLHEIYGRVLVPGAVLEMRHPDAHQEVRAWAMRSCQTWRQAHPRPDGRGVADLETEQEAQSLKETPSAKA